MKPYILNTWNSIMRAMNLFWIFMHAEPLDLDKLRVGGGGGGGGSLQLSWLPLSHRKHAARHPKESMHNH